MTNVNASAIGGFFAKSLLPDGVVISAGARERAMRCRAMAVTAVIEGKKRQCEILRKEILEEGEGVLGRARRIRMEQSLVGLSAELVDLEKAGSRMDGDVLKRVSSEPVFVILSCK